MLHTVMGQNGTACPQCASMNDGYEKTEDTEMASSREEYYRPYDGAPGPWAGGVFFSGRFGRNEQSRINAAAEKRR